MLAQANTDKEAAESQAAKLQEAMCHLGIQRDDTVVVYDTAELGIFSAPRVAWTFRVFGHPAVHILNNFKLWVEQGYPTESGAMKVFERTEQYPTPELDNSKVAAFEEGHGDQLSIDGYDKQYHHKWTQYKNHSPYGSSSLRFCFLSVPEAINNCLRW